MMYVYPDTYRVVIYPTGADWETVDVEAFSDLQAVIKAINIVLDDNVYEEEDIKFSSIEELKEDVKLKGINKIMCRTGSTYHSY